MAEATLVKKAIKAVKGDAAKTEYERGYHNGLVAAEYLSSEGATLEGLAEVKDFVDSSEELKAGDTKQERIQELTQLLEQAEKSRDDATEELSKSVIELAAFRDNSVSLEQHRKELFDMGESMALKDAEIRNLEERLTASLRGPVAPGKYDVKEIPENRDRPWALVSKAGSIISRHRTESEAIEARNTTG